MHYLKFAPLFVYLVFSNVAAVSARPLDQGTTIGDITLGLVGPTAIPNLKLPVGESGAASGAPSVPGAPALPGAGSAVPKIPKTPDVPGMASLPTRRSPSPGNPRLQPRIVRSADYSAASNPNATVPVEPNSATAATKREVKKFRQGWVVPTSTVAPKQGASLEKRATRRKSSKQHSGHAKRPSSKHQKSQKADAPKPQHANAPDNSGPASSSSSGPAAGLANLVKSVGAAPKALSPAANALPATPDTPLTYADTKPTVDAADDTAEQTAAKPVAVHEKEPAPGSNPGAYPSAPSYQTFPNDATVSASTSKSKRHSFVLDTDPLIPPSDETAAKKDPAMGLVNLDSDQKPAPPPAPKVPVTDSAKTTPTPSASKAMPSPSVSIYQPTEPGYVASYPTPGPMAV